VEQTQSADGASIGRREVLGALDGFTLVLDRELRVLDASPAAHKALNGSNGLPCFESLRGREVPCPECPAREALATGERVVGQEVWRPTPDTERKLWVAANPLRSSDGSLLGVVLTEDRARLDHLKAELAERAEACSTLFEEVPCYVSVQDREFRVVHANRRFREDFGDHRGADCMRCYEVYKHRSEACLPCPVAATFADGVSHSSEEVVTTRNGDKADVLVVTAPLRNVKGEIEYVMEMSTNITEMRQVSSQLEELGMLVGQIAHEIKGVLMGLDGGVYMVSTGMERHDRKRTTEGWQMVRRNVDHVRSLALDILYYAKDREPKYRLSSPVRVAEEALKRFEPKAVESGVDVKINLDPAAIRFEVDQRAMEAMLTNLLENALDACRSEPTRDRHAVSLAVRDEGAEIVFEVSDDGVGMDREVRENVFSAFFSSKGSSGTGLGLYIAHRIATQHKGGISVESELGQGTTFTVRIPQRLPASLPHQRPS
jgi:signal transduction histidine kinase